LRWVQCLGWVIGPASLPRPTLLALVTCAYGTQMRGVGGFLSRKALGCSWALTRVSRNTSILQAWYAYNNYICEK
jgi:hypothetical protein